MDGSRQEAKVEITEAVKPPEDEPGEGDEKPQESEIEIELPDDEKIVVDDVEVPPDEVAVDLMGTLVTGTMKRMWNYRLVKI